MSHEGKMRRGKEFSESPKKLQGNVHRQADLDYFLKNSKPKEKK